MYQYILFDLDGTLTDSREGIVNSVRYALQKLDRPVPGDDVLLRFIGPPLQNSFTEVCGMTPEEAARGVALFRERYGPIGQLENAAAPGLPELCGRLRARGLVLALASSKPQAMCEPICARFGYAPYLTAIVGSPPEADWEKPDVIREALRRLGLSEADRPSVLMVGDRKYDVLGAKACGIDCVGVEFFGYAPPGELEAAGAIAVVQTARALEQFILTAP